jgi:protein disulfide isomerase
MQKVLGIFLVALACVLISAVVADEADVFILTGDNFDATINENDFVFVEFYAPWCGHCKKLAPDWEKLAGDLKKAGSPVVVAKIDATEHAGPANTYGVKGYPTIIFFKNGNQIKYEGDRSPAAMQAFLQKKSGPASTELKDKDSLDKFIAANGVIAYVTGGEDSTEYKNWIRSATSGQLEDFSLGHVFDSKLSGSYKDTVVIYKAGDEPLVFNEDKITKTKVVAWITSEGYPLFEEISQPVWQRSQTANKPLLAIFIDNTDEAQLKILQTVAKGLKGRVVVTYGPLPAQKSLAERWGASGNVFPTAVFADWKNSNSPVMTIFNEDTEKAGFNAQTGLAFVESALKDEYQTYLKSEPIPENQAGPLVTLVGKNIESIVNDPTKDVFVEFYAPWCGHCKKLAPVWEELAETFEGVDHVRIAKIDATANNLPKNINVRGYPTLIFFPANNKAGVPFNGERDLPSMTKFVIEQSTKPVKIGKEDL